MRKLMLALTIGMQAGIAAGTESSAEAAWAERGRTFDGIAAAATAPAGNAVDASKSPESRAAALFSPRSPKRKEPIVPILRELPKRSEREMAIRSAARNVFTAIAMGSFFSAPAGFVMMCMRDNPGMGPFTYLAVSIATFFVSSYLAHEVHYRDDAVLEYPRGTGSSRQGGKR